MSSINNHVISNIDWKFMLLSKLDLILTTLLRIKRIFFITSDSEG